MSLTLQATRYVWAPAISGSGDEPPFRSAWKSSGRRPGARADLAVVVVRDRLGDRALKIG
jgi:hypothetical protein